PPKVGLQRLQCAYVLVATGQLLIPDGRRADPRGGHDKRVVRHLIDRNELNRPILADDLLCEQSAEVGAAATTRAEHSGTDGQVIKVALTEVPHRHFSQRSRSPTALMRTRVALPDR